MRGRLISKRPFSDRLVACVRDYFGFEESPTWLRIPRADETEHIMLLGDPGTGKSQTIHHFLLQIAARQPVEAVVIYDPACEFIKRHYDQTRGDVILNPLDKRSPYWSPAAEVELVTDKNLIAESFLPGRLEANQASTSGFFLKAARAIYGRMLELGPTPSQMVSWLRSEEAIDTVVAGTEHTHLIPRNAHGQRAGVLGVLSELGGILRMLPERDECESEIILTEWAKQRRGWIFITSRTDMRESLRPLQAAFINVLMKRLMSVSPEWGQTHPCWLVVDEVHSLNRLPALYETETEGRKYGLKLIQGTQGKTQYEEYYDRLAKAMLAAPKLKLFFRCGEAESARWISDTIGEYEVEKPRIATTASVEDRGRDALNYSTTTEHRQAVSKEEIMALPDLHGYWKYGDAVVPFRLPLAPVKIIARGYVGRELTTDAGKLQSSLSQGGTDQYGDGKQKRIKTRQDRKPVSGTKRQEQAITPNSMLIGDGAAVMISRPAHSSDAQQRLLESSEMEEPQQTRQTLLEAEAFDQEQDGVMNI
jgi:hypothetical protein